MNFVIKHCFVVIIHLFEEVDATYITFNVMDHLGNVPLHFSFDLIVVLDQRYDEIVTHVEQLES